MHLPPGPWWAVAGGSSAGDQSLMGPPLRRVPYRLREDWGKQSNKLSPCFDYTLRLPFEL